MNSHSQRTAFAASSRPRPSLALAGHAGADPIAYDQTPLSNIVAQLGQQYGVSIVLKGSARAEPGAGRDPARRRPGTTPTRLQAINALANAAGVDFQKGIVVSKIATDDVPPPVKIDSNGYVVFKDKTVPARDAIAEIATTDNATIQVSDDVTGDVTFPKTTMRTADAAAEIARQTHTRWRVYYALTPHNMAQRGKVVDHNNGGQAIVQLPFTYYGTKTDPDQTATTAGARPERRTIPALARPGQISPVTYAGPNAAAPSASARWPAARHRALLLRPVLRLRRADAVHLRQWLRYRSGSASPTRPSTATSAAAVSEAMAAGGCQRCLSCRFGRLRPLRRLRRARHLLDRPGRTRD